MTDPMPTQDIAGGTASIYVPYTVSPTVPGYSFFRLGQPDSTAENGLPDDATVPGTPGDGKTTYLAGAMLYTTGVLNITAPTTVVTSPNVTINTLNPTTNPPSFSVGAGVSFVSPSSFNMVLNGTELCSAVLTTSGQSASAFHNRAVTTTYQNTDTFTLSQGVASNFLTGEAQTFWTGNDQSIGFGGLLWANVGATSNIFGGTIVNVTNTGVKIDGLGEYSVTDKIDTSVPTSVKFSVAPSTAAVIASAETLTRIMNGVQGLATLAAGIFSGVALGEINATSENINSLQDQMTKTNIYLTTASDIVTGVQAASLILGIIVQFYKPTGDAVSQLSLTDISASLSALQSKITMAAGITLETLAPPPLGFVSVNASGPVTLSSPEAIALNCGLPFPAGPTVTLTPASVTLAVGPSSITLNPGGITLTGVQITQNSLQAAFAPVVLPPQPQPPIVDAAIVEAQVQVGIVDAVDVL